MDERDVLTALASDHLPRLMVDFFDEHGEDLDEDAEYACKALAMRAFALGVRLGAAHVVANVETADFDVHLTIDERGVEPMLRTTPEQLRAWDDESR